MSSSANNLDILHQEVETFKQLIEILSLEKDSLINGDTEELTALYITKEELLTKSNNLVMARVKSIVSMGFSANQDGVVSWIKSNSSGKPSTESIALQAWHDLQKIAKEAQELNRVNGLLIHKRSTMTQENLVSLRGGLATDSTYGPNGKRVDNVQSRSLVIG